MRCLPSRRPIAAGVRFCDRSRRIISRSAKVRCVYRVLTTHWHTRRLRARERRDQCVRYVSLEYYVRDTAQVAGVYSVRYTAGMPLTSRTAMLHARVRPDIKFAGERVLRGLGLSMSDLMELVLRRLIVEQKLPFEAIALDDHQLTAIASAWEENGATSAIKSELSRSKRLRKREKRE